MAGALALAAPALAAGNGAVHASATLRDATGAVIGTARFTEDATGVVHVNVHVQDLSPGLHGIHIHAIGNCTPGAGPSFFTAAGAHHNPLGAHHGTESPLSPHPHAGDLPNLIVNGAGVGHLDAKTEFTTLSSGPTSVFDADGSALVIHALPDDLHTDPTGNSGPRVACGVIES